MHYLGEFGALGVKFSHFFIHSRYRYAVDVLCNIQLAKMFSQPVGCLFRLWGLFLNFIQPNLSIIVSCAIGALLRQSMPKPVSSCFIYALSMFSLSYNSFKASGLTLRPWNPFKLMFVLG